MAQVQGGAKLGTRIATLVSNSIIYTHNRLHSAKHKLAMAVFSTISDVVSEEVHDTIGPILRKMHDEHDPQGLAYGLIHFAATQHGQLQAAVGTAASASGILSSVGEIVNNELSPSVRGILRTNPHLLPDVNTVARLAAMNLSTPDNAVGAINEQGIDSGWANALIAAQRSYPDVSTALELLRRNEIESAHFREWMLFNGYRSQDIDYLVTLARNPISAADAALALLRGNLSHDEALAIAREAGVTETDFNTLVNNTGEPLGLMQLLEARRRGFIDDGRLVTGILQSRVRNEWVDVAKKLAYSPITVADAVNANVQGHITTQQGNDIANQNGLEPGWFDTLVATAGEPLSRTEMEELFNRGLVTQAQVKQALLESRLKNKYTDLAFALHTKLLPIRNLSEAVEFGTLTLAQGVTEAMKQGYSEQDATALIQAASARKLQSFRHQVVSAVEALYVDNAISEDDAMAVAQSMGYDDPEAKAVLAGAEYKRMAKMLATGMNAVKSKYVSRHIDQNTASGLLDAMGIPADRRDQELAIWTLERQADARLLTPAQVVKANKLTLMTDAEATDYLENLGYSPSDASLLLQGA